MPNFRVLRTWDEKLHSDWLALIDPEENERPVRHVEYESDFWKGPDRAGEVGRYVRQRFVVNVRHWRHQVSPNISFWSELKKALRI
jgi:hypothetical protein